MGNYLTENTIFGCPFLTGVIRCFDSSHSVAYSCKKILTDRSEVSSKVGMCSSPAMAAKYSGTPGPWPCECSLTRWMNVVTNVKVSGNYPLTSVSSNQCVMGGAVTPKSFFSKAENGLHKNIGSLATLIFPKLTSGTETSESSTKNFVNERKSNVYDENVAQAEKVETNEEIKEEDKDSLCPCCEKKDSCEYRRASSEVNNDSIILRQNYEEKLKLNKDECDKHFLGVRSKFPQYVYAAHHIISGNQVFKQYPEVVKMANFCGYDINNALNCIMLVSKQEGYGESTDFGKDAKKYGAMADTKLQWHLGGHEYNFNTEELKKIRHRIEKKIGHPLGDSIKNYAVLLQEEIAKIEATLSQNKVCRNTPQQKSGFVRRMNSVSKKVRNYLSKFCYSYEDSYPYYVSKPAYNFAFDIPSSGKICIVRKNGNGYSIEKYSFTCEQGGLKFKPCVTKSLGSHIAEFSFKDKNKTIIFCEDVIYFVFVGSAKKYLLPFELRYDKDFAFYVNEEMNTDIILKDDGHKLLAWLTERQVENPQSAVQKIKERIGGVK